MSCTVRERGRCLGRRKRGWGKCFTEPLKSTSAHRPRPYTRTSIHVDIVNALFTRAVGSIREQRLPMILPSVCRGQGASIEQRGCTARSSAREQLESSSQGPRWWQDHGTSPGSRVRRSKAGCVLGFQPSARRGLAKLYRRRGTESGHR